MASENNTKIVFERGAWERPKFAKALQSIIDEYQASPFDWDGNVLRVDNLHACETIKRYILFARSVSYFAASGLIEAAKADGVSIAVFVEDWNGDTPGSYVRAYGADTERTIEVACDFDSEITLVPFDVVARDSIETITLNYALPAALYPVVKA